jgi:hypothetical protein
MLSFVCCIRHLGASFCYPSALPVRRLNPSWPLTPHPREPPFHTAGLCPCQPILFLQISFPWEPKLFKVVCTLKVCWLLEYICIMLEGKRIRTFVWVHACIHLTLPAFNHSSTRVTFATVLKALLIVIYLICPKPFEVCMISMPILQMGTKVAGG